MSNAPKADWVPDGRLRQHLLITSSQDLSIFGDTEEAPAGSEYRVVGMTGTVVQIEVRTRDGRFITGYTSENKVNPHRTKKSWWKR